MKRSIYYTTLPSFKLQISRGKFLSIKNQVQFNTKNGFQQLLTKVFNNYTDGPTKRNVKITLLYRGFFMLPVVLIDATNFTIQGATIQFLVTFNYVLQYIFSHVFLFHVKWPHRLSVVDHIDVLYVQVYRISNWVDNISCRGFTW